MKLIKLLLTFSVLTFTFTAINAQKTNPKTSIFSKKKDRKQRKTPVIVTPPPKEDVPVIADESPLPYFVGGGNEPGWNIEMLQGMDASMEVKIVADYGEKNYKTQLFKQTIKFGDSFREVYASKPDTNGKSEFEAQFVNEPCTDDAGQSKDARIVLKTNERTYNGCGDFAKNMPMELNGKYVVMAINGVKTNQTNTIVNIDIFRRNINANMGCNTMTGNFFASKGEIKPLVLAATRMACTDMKLENDFMAATQLIKTYTNSDYGIFLLNEKKQRILELKRL